ncbi:MAG TPA: lysophospholipid acyltransferase family protein [Candidatus Limnocylindrales bacterium]|nr:lysophospholipid acyltransferase family protein [Candidatus Limnocylindrales bacterium]
MTGAAAPPAAEPARPRAAARDVRSIHPLRRLVRAWISRIVSWLLVRAYLRPRLVDRRLLPKGPAIYCFNHLNWTDPFILMGTLPMRPRLTFFGPKEEDMTVGGRNRLMNWTGATIPYRPGKNDLLEATRRVVDALRAGGVVAIAGEGRIQPFESAIRPLSEGPAYFALRAGVPMVPIAINGTSWLCLGRRVRVRIGQPLEVTGRPTRQAVDELTERCRRALQAIVADEPEHDPPGPFGRRVTELFNEWPEGDRAAAEAAGRALASAPDAPVRGRRAGGSAAGD